MRKPCLIFTTWMLPLLLAGGWLHSSHASCKLPFLQAASTSGMPLETSAPTQLVGVLLNLVQADASAPVPGMAQSVAQLESVAMNMGIILAGIVLLLALGIGMLLYGVYKGKIRIKSTTR